MCLPKQSPLSTIVYAYTLIAESTSVGETHKSFVPWGGGGLGECWNVVGWGNVGMFAICVRESRGQSAESNGSC